LLSISLQESFLHSVFVGSPGAGTKKATGIKPMASKIVEAIGSFRVCPWPQSECYDSRWRTADPLLKQKKKNLGKRTCALVSIKKYSSMFED
jgi:hypothetical protein